MVGKALSEANKKQLAREEKAKWQDIATARYKAEQAEPKPRGLQKICDEVMAEFAMANPGRTIKLNAKTLANHVNGGRTISEFNSDTKSWLSSEEALVVIDYCISVARRAFPLSHRRLKEHVNEILRARLGDAFPSQGVSHNWTGRFLDKHKDRIGMCWSHTLDSKRGRAVNPATDKAWYDLLESILLEENIEQDCLYAADESGFQTAMGLDERVIGPAGTKRQYQQRDGTRENITVNVTICADGTSIPPAVIFKGEAFLPKWKQDNPLNAALGYSQKGWVTGEIGVAWIKDFDAKTRGKANGRTRLLIVDGHNSHYTRGFLEFAREHKIIVLCYPAHSTHVYQGLDVVVFGPLKQNWSAERDKLQRETGQAVTKENFLGVYGRAHIKTLTSNLVCAAFEKTGIWPFNRLAVPREAFAPSEETSRNANMPLDIGSPARIMASMFQNMAEAHRQPIPTTPVRAHTAAAAEPAVVPQTPRRARRNRPPILPLGPAHPAGQLPHTPPHVHANIFPSTPIPALRLDANPINNLPTPSAPLLPGFRDPDVQFLVPSYLMDAFNQLSESSAAFLVANSPIKSYSQPPELNPVTMSPIKPHYNHLLSNEPGTEREKLLQLALRNSEIQEAYLKGQLRGQQAAMLLQQLYCERVRRQLAVQEGRKGKKKGGKLMGDGLPKLLTGDEFTQLVIEHEEALVAKETKRVERKAMRDKRGERMVEWNKRDAERKVVNAKITAAWKAAVVLWTAEKARAKVEGRRFLGGPQPKRGPLQKAAPKPKAVIEVEEVEQEEEVAEEESSEEGEDSDDDSEESELSGFVRQLSRTNFG